MLAQLVQKEDWCVKIDLKDAYFCLSVAREHRKYLRFQWQGQTLEFQTLPFGLGSAPRTFTKNNETGDRPTEENRDAPHDLPG